MALDEQSSYYDAGGIEVFKIIKAKLTLEQWRGFLLGNVLKYASRMNHKGCAERDVQKCHTYVTLLKETFKEERERHLDEWIESIVSDPESKDVDPAKQLRDGHGCDEGKSPSLASDALPKRTGQHPGGLYLDD